MEHIPNKRRYRRINKMNAKRPIPSFEYFVDENKEGEIDGRHYKGIVVAKMKETYCPLAFAWDRKYGYSFSLLEDIYYQFCNREGYKVSRVPKTPNLTGIAYCFDGDSFDLEKGKEIARTKVWVKYYDWQCIILGEFAREVYNFNEFIFHMREQMENRFNVAYNKAMKNSYSE